jgi:hypothetical protein
MKSRSISARRLARRRGNARALLLTFGAAGAAAGPIVLRGAEPGETSAAEAPAAKPACTLLLKLSVEEVKLK